MTAAEENTESLDHHPVLPGLGRSDDLPTPSMSPTNSAASSDVFCRRTRLGFDKANRDAVLAGATTVGAEVASVAAAVPVNAAITSAAGSTAATDGALEIDADACRDDPSKLGVCDDGSR